MAFVKVLGGGVVTRPGQWGASCLFFSFDGINIVVDCGIRLNTSESVLPDLNWLKDKRVDAILITHAHTDHVGATPLLTDQHPEAKVFMTFETAEISRILLYDNVEFSERYSQSISYSREQCEKLFERIRIAEFEDWQTIEAGGKQISFCFWKAGHIRGAASILFVNNATFERCLVSGDISFQSLPTVEGAKPVPTTFAYGKLTVITEATNGGVVIPNRLQEEERLVARVNEVQARRGHVLIPAFSVGRAQDVALALARGGVKVLLGGMAKQILQSDAFGSKYSHQFISKLDGNRENIDLISRSSKPKVVVTTHGMMEGGQSVELALRWMSDERNAIFFPGYQAPGTLGKRIQSAKPGKKIFFNDRRRIGAVEQEEWRELKATVESFKLSAHSDGPQLAKWIEALNPQRTYIVHAQKEGAGTLRQLLRTRPLRGPVLEAYNNNAYGI